MKKTFLTLLLVLSTVSAHAYLKDQKSFERVAGVVSPEVLILDNGQQVRLIGIDGTEKKHPERFFEERSTQFVRKHMMGQKVRLEYDWVKRDPNGRPMVYVYRVPDNWFLNAALIGEGHAFIDASYPPGTEVRPKKPFKLYDDYKQYEESAKKDRKGLWLTLDVLTKPRDLV